MPDRYARMALAGQPSALAPVRWIANMPVLRAAHEGCSAQWAGVHVLVRWYSCTMKVPFEIGTFDWR